MTINSISEENKHIEAYLVDYFERPDTEYAVMINGPWGTGKTWFIKQIKEKYNAGNIEILYVSLNGIAKTTAIDAELFRAMHPILGSDATKLLAKVGTTLFKIATKVDLNNDGEQETLTISMPTIDTSDLVKNDKKAILVFDDLERCQVQLKEVLGYINYFVEQKGFKVVVVSDESKIKDDEYYVIKEKLVGTTFLLEGSYINAINAFLEEKSLSKIKGKLTQNKEIIYDVYDRSGFKNLRSIKQALQEFSRFYHNDYFDREGGIEVFEIVLKYFLIFSLEFRAGTFEDKILEFKEDTINEPEKEQINPVRRLLENKSRNAFLGKYNVLESNYYIFDMDTWTDLIIFNKLNREKISEQLHENFYKLLSEKPDWYKLWHFDDLNQDQFDQSIKNIIINLSEKKYVRIGELKHIFGLFCFFFNKKILNLKDLKDIEKLILDNVDTIFKNKENFQLYLNEKKYMIDESWDGHGFYEVKNNIVQEIFKEIEEMSNRQKIENCKKDAPNILTFLINNELDKFSENLISNDNFKGIFWNDPILNEIDVNIFALTLIEFNKNQMLSLVSTLYTRYQTSRSVYEIERKWLLKIIEYIEKIILPKKIGIVALKISDRILPYLKDLKKEMDFRYGFKPLSDDMSI